jgi:hypothetical protein
MSMKRWMHLLPAVGLCACGADVVIVDASSTQMLVPAELSDEARSVTYSITNAHTCVELMKKNLDDLDIAITDGALDEDENGKKNPNRQSKVVSPVDAEQQPAFFIPPGEDVAIIALLSSGPPEEANFTLPLLRGKLIGIGCAEYINVRPASRFTVDITIVPAGFR